MLLHAQIEANKRKTWIVVTSFFLFFAVVGVSVGIISFDDPVSGLILAVVFGMGYIGFMLSAGTNVVMAMNRAVEIKSEDDNPFLWNTVESLAIGARLPMPRVFIINDPSPNAFAAGMSPKKAAVAVTTGLLERLNREEVEAVLAHEMAHIRNYDVRLATTAIALVAVIAMLSDLAMRLFFWGGGSSKKRSDSNSSNNGVLILIALVVVLLAPLISTLIQLAISRNREYLADVSGAELCRNPNALASALRKISAVEEPVKTASQTCAALYFADPFKKRKKKRSLFSTHPPTEERIYRLEQMM